MRLPDEEPPDRHQAGGERGGRAEAGRVAGVAPRERNAPLLSAGYAPAFPESPLDATDVRPVREALDGILEGHLPYPAVVAGPRGELVAANAAFDVPAEGGDPELLEPPVNLLPLALHPRGMAPRMVNLDVWGRHIVENLRARAARTPDPLLDALAEEPAGYVPPCAPDEDCPGFAVALRLRCAEGELRLLTTLTSSATAVDVTLAELHLEAFLPADARTAQILRKRAAQRR
ncbi:transcriptional regulator [Streptomyces sp. NPDC005202]|uniref:MmyB family transcriptional regulator n=1 Tax=Streptomyces sp. NPDC005202 TaxID=3157021 RepID=UPI00339E4CED